MKHATFPFVCWLIACLVVPFSAAGVNAAESPTANKASSFTPADESAAPTPALAPAASQAAWEVRAGFRIELVAAEPLVMDPVAIDWDPEGRLWVVEMADYPNGLDGQGQPGGRIRVLEDQNEDGQYETSHLFIDGLNFPTGIVTYRQGVIVTAAPDILYLEDTNGDNICDLKKVLFSGYSQGNQQLRVNGLRWGLEGWLYCASGSHVANFGKDSKIKSHLTGQEIPLGSRDFRFHPETGELEPLSGPSQFGRNCDAWGNWFGVQNSYPLWHYVLEDDYLSRNPHLPTPDPKVVMTAPNPRVYPAKPPQSRFHSQNQAGRFTSACSGMIYRDTLLFPSNEISHAFTCEPVHNLVQHNHLVRSGVSFEMSRDVSGKSVDFLASRDRWTRPVMTRTGPDGALWVVDMYRYVIEHPHWLPKEAQAVVAPYLRAGDGRGRIYRVVPQEQPPRSIPKLARLTTAELVSRLDDPSGWVRDAAKQLLLEKPPADVRAALLPMLTTAATPQGKLNAWYALQMIEPCDQSLLIQGLTDPENEIRRHTLRFAEAIEQPGAAMIDAVKRLSTDADPAVRLQLALSLGAWKQPFASALIGEILTQEDSSPFIRSALLSSLNESNIAEVAIAVARMPMRDAGFRDVYRKVARQSLDYRQHQPLIEACAIEDPTDQELARAIVVAGVARQFWGPTLKGIPTEIEASLGAVVRHARTVLVTETSPQWLRTLAIDALFLLPNSLSTDLDTARSLLQPTVPFELQLALIQHLGKQSEPECCGLMLQGWSGYSPKTRDSILEAVLSQPTWHSQLVKALDEQDVKVSDVSLSLRQRFLSQPDSKAFHKHFRQVAPDDQRRPLNTQRFQMSQGNAERGKEVFVKNCSSCHRLDDEGKHIGPNLESLTNPTVASLLEAILEPNNAVEAKYQTYLVVTADGRIISGMITSESNNSLTILRPDGESSAVRRSDIDEIQATGKSLMPEGFDRVISSGQMADLLTYLHQQQQAAQR